MARTSSLLLEEFHLTVRAPRDLSEGEYAAIRRTLDSRRFQARLAQAARAVARRSRSLGHVRLTLSR
jgi:hypothetical protein